MGRWGDRAGDGEIGREMGRWGVWGPGAGSVGSVGPGRGEIRYHGSSYSRFDSYEVNRIFSRLPTPDSRLPRCAFRRRIKFATGRTAPDSRLPTQVWDEEFFLLVILTI
ncbi:hypothetical protein [Moorena producens]|uniref:hypothetical protein n=1 Tax=Moorena producens TaxID=1155739 RepID=UPI0013143CD0|nr:hypothetical protein [Moorena producens]